MTKNKNKGKAVLAGLAMFASAIPASAQEKLEIQVTETNGVSRTIEVDRNIRQLDLYHSGLTSIILPDGLTNLKRLNLDNNKLTNLTLPEGLTNLKRLNLDNNRLTNLTLPEGLTNLKSLRLGHNEPLTHLALPEGLRSLDFIDLVGNSNLSYLTFPKSFTRVGHLDIRGTDLPGFLLIREEMNSMRKEMQGGFDRLDARIDGVKGNLEMIQWGMAIFIAPMVIALALASGKAVYDILNSWAKKH